MTLLDLINAGFELSAGAAQAQNCRRLLRDRAVAGVDWRVTGFFAAWGIWNLLYYPALGQYLSFTGGVAVTAANITWVVLALRFRS